MDDVVRGRNMARAATHLVARPRPRARQPIDPMPRDIEPMLAVLSELPADQHHYNFESKWDGVRALCYYDGRTFQLQSRNRLEITHRYPELHALTVALGRRSAVLDGEIVAMDEV